MLVILTVSYLNNQVIKAIPIYFLHYCTVCFVEKKTLLETGQQMPHAVSK